jgi:hypothetical protein
VVEVNGLFVSAAVSLYKNLMQNFKLGAPILAIASTI